MRRRVYDQDSPVLSCIEGNALHGTVFFKRNQLPPFETYDYQKVGYRDRPRRASYEHIKGFPASYFAALLRTSSQPR
jgi:hypothetical protein